MSLKVLLLTDGIYPLVIGGMQKHSLNLTQALLECGIQVSLVYCGKPGVKESQIEDVRSQFTKTENLELIFVPFPKRGVLPNQYITNSLQYSKRVWNSISDRIAEFDLIYCKGFAGWQLLRAKSFFDKFPETWVNFHGYEMFQKATNLTEKLKLFLFQKPVKENLLLADKVVSYGGAITEILLKQGIKSDRIVQIPGGIKREVLADNLNSKNWENPKFLFVGRYERRKGIQELNAALRILSKDGLKLNITFVGPIPKEAQLPNNTKGLSLSYLGQIDNGAELLKIFDNHEVLILPSFSEGMPNVILEAMARGLVILANPVGAVTSLVDDSNGLLMKENSPEEIARCIKCILEMSPEKLLNMASNSLGKIDNEFCWDKIASMHLTEMGK